MTDAEINGTVTFMASNGREVALEASDLEHIAESYDSDYHEAPVVIEHPPSNGPAYGRVNSLRFASSRLMAS